MTRLPPRLPLPPARKRSLRTPPVPGMTSPARGFAARKLISSCLSSAVKILLAWRENVESPLPSAWGKYSPLGEFEQEHQTWPRASGAIVYLFEFKGVEMASEGVGMAQLKAKEDGVVPSEDESRLGYPHVVSARRRRPPPLSGRTAEGTGNAPASGGFHSAKRAAAVQCPARRC